MRRGLALVMLCSCSFVFVHGPQPAPAPATDCTTSRVVPVLDTIFTALALASAVYTTVESEHDWNKEFCDEFDNSCSAPVPQGVGVAIYSVLAAAGGAGMYYGFTRTEGCRKAQSEAPPITVTPPPPGPVDAGVPPADADTGPPIPTGLPVPGGN